MAVPKERGRNGDAPEAVRAERRPDIPEWTIRQLWGLAGGRCEFRGCNEPVYKDRLTHAHRNMGCVSHIVSWVATGPRGDPVRSPILAKKIENLMLTCLVHGRLIDDGGEVENYPEERLLQFKAQHEQRVRMLTSVSEVTRTEVLVVRVPIDGGQEVPIGKEVFEAILPDFPAREVPQRIDLNDMGPVSDAAGFGRAASSLATRIKSILRMRQEDGETSTLSVFAIAPVPLLVYLGTALGDMVPVQTFQRRRRFESWSWEADLPDGQEENYLVTAPDESEEGAREVALFLDVSARVPQTSVAGSVLAELPRYRLTAPKPSVDFLCRRQQVRVFGVQLRELLARIAEENPEASVLHLVAAVPAPIAIELGRHLRFSIRTVQTYEFNKRERAYWPCLLYTPTEVPV